MSTPHKHAKFIKAMADGDSVDVRTVDSNDQSWARLLYFYPFDHTGIEFRLTPHRWQAEIDAQAAGKVIQERAVGGDAWNNSDGALFDAPHLEFRIKPDVLRYRVYTYKSPFTGCLSIQTTSEDVEGMPYFVKWLGDWQEVEA